MNKKEIKEFELKEQDDTLYIRLPEKYYDEWKLYKNGIFELKEGLTILVGCNGYGKSTTMHAFENIIQKAEYITMSFDNYRDGGKRSVGDALFVNDIGLAATILTGSEGEGILSNISKMAMKLGNYVRYCDQDKLFVFLDAIDGLSINIINELKNDLLKRALKDAKSLNKKLYIFVSANDYEFANGEQCLDVYNNKYITFKDYEEYKKFILKTDKIKSKRY
jgi:energy-coupling factor transporter ATP-binding protein EcfA2